MVVRHVSRLRLFLVPTYLINAISLSYADDWSRVPLVVLTMIYAALTESAFHRAQQRDIEVERAQARAEAEARRRAVARQALKIAEDGD